MLSETTKKIYDALINKYYEMADTYHGMYIDFMSGIVPLKGMAYFCCNESVERWKAGKNIVDYLIEYRDAKPELFQLPKPETAYNSPDSALSAALNKENELLMMFQNNIGNVEITEYHKMNELYNYAHMQFNEVNGIKKMLAIPGGSIWEVDEYLKKKFNPCYKK